MEKKAIKRGKTDKSYLKKSCDALKLAFLLKKCNVLHCFNWIRRTKRARIQSLSYISSENEADDFALISTITFNIDSVHLFIC